MFLETGVPEPSSSETPANCVIPYFSDISRSPPAKEEAVLKHFHVIAEHANDLRWVRHNSDYRIRCNSFLTHKHLTEGHEALWKYLWSEYGSQMLAQAKVKNHIKHPKRLVTESLSFIHSRSVCLLAPCALCHRQSSILRSSTPNDLLFTILPWYYRLFSNPSQFDSCDSGKKVYLLEN